MLQQGCGGTRPEAGGNRTTAKEGSHSIRGVFEAADRPSIMRRGRALADLRAVHTNASGAVTLMFAAMARFQPTTVTEFQMPNRMTTAERRGYQQICGRNGRMMVVACDQRGAMRKILASTPEEQARIDQRTLGDVKSDIVAYLANSASCVLLDPVCAVPRVVDEGVLARDTALLIGLDASGWDTDADGYRLSKLVPGIGARRVRELGGTGGKLMVYLRPDRPEANTHNIEIIRGCVADFAREDLLLVV